MSCHQSINTNALLRQVQEQVSLYRKKKNERLRPQLKRTSAELQPSKSIAPEEDDEPVALPKAMMIQPCMKQAIQTNLLSDTTLIPIQLVSVTTSNIATTNTDSANDSESTTVLPTILPIAQRNDSEIVVTPTEDAPTEDVWGNNHSTTTTAAIKIASPKQPPPLSSTPNASLGHSSPPKSFRKLIRLPSKGNRRPRSISSESSESSSTSNQTDTVFAVPATVAITTSKLTITDEIKEIHALPPIRFSTLMQGSTASSATTTNGNWAHRSAGASGAIGSIAVLIRRPGCSLCQQHAYTLTLLSKILCPEYFTTTLQSSSPSTPSQSTAMNTDNDTLQKNLICAPMFTIFGIVKDIYDTVGIIECQQLYFPFPMYMNSTYTFSHAFGDRKLSLTHIFTSSQAWKTMFCTMYQNIFSSLYSSPMTVTTGHSATASIPMHPQDAIANSSTAATATTTSAPPPPPSSSSHKADGILQGGLLFLSHTGTPMAMLPEETGQPLNIGYILQTLDFMIQQHNKDKETNTGMSQ